MELPRESLVDLEVARRVLRRAAAWEYTWPCLLAFVVMALHFGIIGAPAQPVSDETHYVTDARSIIAGQGTLRVEHPPMAKLVISLGIIIFGDNPVGWRFFSIVFGTGATLLIYLISRRLKLSRTGALIAAFIFSFENLAWVMGHVAMLDVFSVTLMLTAFWLYLRGDFLPAAVVMAFSALAKYTGILGLPVIFLHWLCAGRKRPAHFLASMVLFPVALLALLPLPDFLSRGQFVDPISSLRTTLSLNSSQTFANTDHPNLSRPWEWILSPGAAMPFWYDPKYTAAISYTVWALIIPAALYLLFRAMRGNYAAIFGISWFAGTYLVWIPASLITDRISFVFYFYPTVGIICITLGMVFSQLIGLWQNLRTKHKRRPTRLGWAALSIVGLFLAGHLAVFIIMSPFTRALGG